MANRYRGENLKKEEVQGVKCYIRSEVSEPVGNSSQ